MITLTTLKYLSSQKQKDADALFRSKRNVGAIYLMGYALELSFKRKICLTFGFIHGFPETKIEYRSYAAQVSTYNAISTGVQLNKLDDIKSHSLNSLLTFSGAENRILNLCYDEWQMVKSWDPQSRYERHYISVGNAQRFIMSAKKIIKLIT
jgi:hypothetical protein